MAMEITNNYSDYGKGYTKDKQPHYGLHPPYVAVCFFRRPAGRTDNGNHLESGGIRGNMLTRRFAFPLYRTNGEKL